MRAAVTETLRALEPAELDRLLETVKLTMSVPELRARATDEFLRTIDVMAAPLARRAGRAPEDPEVRHVVGAMIGVITAATMVPLSDDPAELVARIDAGLAHLEQGLPL
jgi:hypothetical protein